MDHSGDWWALMWVGMIVMWTLVVAAIWLIFAANRPNDHRDTGEEILARRLARGEIGRDEYRALLDELHDRPGRPRSRGSGGE